MVCLKKNIIRVNIILKYEKLDKDEQNSLDGLVTGTGGAVTGTGGAVTGTGGAVCKGATPSVEQ